MKELFVLLITLLFAGCVYVFGIGFLVTLVGAFVSLMAPDLINVSFWLPLTMCVCWVLSFVLAVFSAALSQ